MKSFFHWLFIRPAITPVTYLAMVLIVGGAVVLTNIKTSRLAEENGELRQMLFQAQEINKAMMKHFGEEAAPMQF